MKRVLLSLLLVGLMALPAFAQCGPNGCNVPRDDGWRVVPNRQPATIERSREREVKKTQPTPAWRYERAEGHWKSAVRVHVWERSVMESQYVQRDDWYHGSGVLVLWRNRKVILTAAHVLRGGKKIFVEFGDGIKRPAKVLKADEKWDCAVLKVDNVPDDATPAEMALSGVFQKGTRLETCGFGEDGQFAVSTGSFQRYTRTGESPLDGPTDWMQVSGTSRDGDSGGPVFDEQGRVAGIIWGARADDGLVRAVQNGRVQIVLDEAIPKTTEVAEEGFFQSQRKPKEQPPQYRPQAMQPMAQPAKKPLLPWRGDAVTDQNAQDARIEALIRLQENQRQGTTVDVQVGPQQPVKPPEKPPLLWLWGVGGLLLAVGIYYVGQKN